MPEKRQPTDSLPVGDTMPKLPTLHWLPAPQGYAERLARWRELWLIEQQMRAADPDYAGALPFAPREAGANIQTENSRWQRRPETDLSRIEPDKSKGDSLFAHRDAQIADSQWRRLADPGIADIAPEVGQIRLLAGWLVPEARRPVYVAVLFAWEGNVFLIAPYGPFPEPATTAELLTGRPAAALRVLALWNGRTVPPALLAEGSRFVDRLAPEELQAARTVFRHAFSGEDMPEEVWSRVGCPIVHPRDPRIAYQDEETQLLTTLTSLADTKAENSLVESQPKETPRFGTEPSRTSGRGGIQVPLQAAWHHEQFSLSAAPLAEVGHQKFLAPEFKVEIVARFDPSAPRRWIVVYPQDGPGLSRALHGCRVLIRTKDKSEWREAAPINDCMVDLPVEATEFILLTSNGTEIKIVPIA